jgi:hypothetical protein
MLTNKAYSEDLWNILAALRGPDSRDRKIKYATTAVIRSSAFPKHPCSALSVFGDDKDHLVSRRKQLFRTRKDANHFREHVAVAFEALGLKLYARNKLSEELWDTNRFSKK